MFSKVERFLKWQRILLMLALLFAASISASSAIAGKLTDTADNGKSAPGAPNTQDAFLFLRPNTDTPGSCAAPANGGTTQVGCRFVLDLVINTGNNPDDTTAQ